MMYQRFRENRQADAQRLQARYAPLMKGGRP
jgi:hypothetical protein